MTVNAANDLHSLMRELETLGKPQTRKTYARHGVAGPMYGVSYADLGKLRKRIKRDHALALQLWQTGNHDARILATMIADPEQVDEALARSWAADVKDYVLADAVVTLLARTPLVRPLAEEWAAQEDEYLGRIGYHLLGQLAQQPDLPDSYFESCLRVIEQDIHSAANRKRQAMNNALIAIGIRNDALEEQATATAARIGKVAVDHGDTSCKTPDAIPYIRKARNRLRERAARSA